MQFSADIEIVRRNCGREPIESNREQISAALRRMRLYLTGMPEIEKSSVRVTDAIGVHEQLSTIAENAQATIQAAERLGYH